MSKQNTKENYFNVQIDKDIDEEFAYLLEKAPYTNEKDIDELFSHLAYIDEVQKEKSAKDIKLCDKLIKLKFVYNDHEGAKVENLQIPLGQGHFTKGINHLRKIGKQDWEKDIKEKNFDDELSKKFDKYLSKPPAMEVLGKGTLGTLQHCAKILETIPSPELQSFLEGFMQGSGFDRLKLFQENTQDQKTTEQEKNKEQEIKEFKAEVKAASQKKTKGREYEISNNKNIGMAR